MTENDFELLSIVVGPFNPFVLLSVNSRNNDLSTPSFLFRVLSLPCGNTIKIAGSVCRLSVCTHVTTLEFLNEFPCFKDRLCDLVVRVSGYRYRGIGFDSRRYQIF